jgi:hypothetical protein
MNLTHEHEQGVHAVVETGVLELLAELLRSCCCSSSEGTVAAGSGAPAAKRLSLTSPETAGGLQGVQAAEASRLLSTKPVSTAASPPSLPSHRPVNRDCDPARSVILEHLDLVTMCLGLLINLTSAHQESRALLREVKLQGISSGTSDTGIGDEGGGLVPLLCHVVNLLASSSLPAHHKESGSEQKHGGAPQSDPSRQCQSVEHLVGLSAIMASVEHDPDSTSIPDASEDAYSHKPIVEVTADELSGGHEDGEAAIVQVSQLLCWLIVHCMLR